MLIPSVLLLRNRIIQFSIKRESLIEIKTTQKKRAKFKINSLEKYKIYFLDKAGNDLTCC